MYIPRLLLSNLVNCFSLATLVASLPADNHQLPPSRRDAAIEQSVFYGINGSELEQRITKLKEEGYRPTSLNIHGSPTDAKYAGIWTKQPGYEFETIIAANETTYNAWMDQWRAAGYVSTHVSATGAAPNALFAGVMQQISLAGDWTQLCGLDDPYAYINGTAGIKMTIKGVSMYGLPSKHQYCVLGHENVLSQRQSVWYQTDSFVRSYEELKASETSKRYWRPVYIDVSEDGILTPIFDDTSVGQWAALTSLTKTQLDSEILARKAQNMHPIHIAGGGNEEATYAVIFAEEISPLSRGWHATGEVTGFTDNAGLTSALDTVMKTFMQRNSVRQAQVAASVNGTVVASRAYTWAESDRAIVEPSDKFLLASVSKIFTHAAVDHLVSTGLINLTTTVYPLLGYNDPTDKRSLDITVQQLLNHTAGFDRSKSSDPGFIFTSVGRSLKKSTGATLRDVIEHMVAQPLDFTPGTREEYSNYGTMLLSYVIVNLTNMTYLEYINKEVLGGADVELYGTASELHKSDRIVQESQYTGISSLTPLSDARIDSAHGGDGSNREEAVGAFGLKASAATIAQFIGSHAVWGIGGRESWLSRDGSLSGARTFAYSRPELDWALTMNTRDYSSEAAWGTLVYEGLDLLWNRFELAT